MENKLCFVINGYGFYSAEDIVEAHQKVIDEKGFVYWSTSSRIDKHKLSAIRNIVFYNRNCAYEATLEGFTDKKPDDFLEYTPEIFKGEKEKKLYIKLSNIRKISLDKLKNCSFHNPKLNDKYDDPYVYIRKSGRLQNFYINSVKETK